MSNGQLVEQKPPVWRAVVTLAVAAFLLYSCMSPSDDEKRRDERIDAEDSTTVIVEAPTGSCWELEAFDERLDEGRLKPASGEDELDNGEENEIREGPGEKIVRKCGPAKVALPEGVVPGAVYLTLDRRRDDRTHPAIWFAVLHWLTKDGSSRGGGVVLPGDDRDFVAVFAQDAPKLHGGNRYDRTVVAKEAFPTPNKPRFSPTERAAFARHGVDLTRFIRDIDKAGRAARSAQTPGEAADSTARYARAIGTALTVRGLLDWQLPDTASYDDTSGQSMDLALKRFAAGDYTVTAKEAATGLRAGLAAVRADRARRTFSQAGESSAWDELKPLLALDPHNAPAYHALHQQWLNIEAAEYAQLEAEMDAWVDSLGTGSGGWYPGCDGDGDGICNE